MSSSLIAVVPDSSAQRYGSIPGRNAFGLKPPPKPEVNAPPPQVPKIVLTGITTVLGNKRALMKLQPAAGKPAEAGKDNSLILTEGQREGDIEVIEIDEIAGSVKVNNSGTVMILTFEKDGPKLPTTPFPPVAATGLPPMPGGIPAPLPNPGNINPATGLTNATGIRPLPTRRFRLPATRGVPVTSPGESGAAAPIGGLPTPAGMMPTPVAQPATTPQDLTAEEQAILQQVQREAGAAAAPAPGTTTPANGQPVYPQ